MPNILYAITDSFLMPGEKLFTGVELALQAGCTLVQYREKSPDDEQRLYEAARLVALCEQYDAKLIVNDDVALAKKSGAHGVHLGQDDGSPVTARMLLGPEAIIGVTCHDSLDLAKQAVADGANYVAFGRFFSSSTKPQALQAPVTLISQARKKFNDTTIVAIGGITPANARILLEAGADMLAVCHSVFATDDIKMNVENFLHLTS